MQPRSAEESSDELGTDKQTPGALSETSQSSPPGEFPAAETSSKTLRGYLDIANIFLCIYYSLIHQSRQNLNNGFSYRLSGNTKKWCGNMCFLEMRKQQ